MLVAGVAKIRVKRFKLLQGGVVAVSVECRTCDQQIVGSTLGRTRGVIKTLSEFFTPMCLCHQASLYRPGGDALRLGSNGRYGFVCGLQVKLYVTH